MLSGNINGPCTLPLLPALNTALQTQEAAGPAIPLLVQRLDYATLRPDAVTAGLMTGQNDQLFDVPGRTQSPYRVRTLFAAAPARSTAPTGDVSFVFPQALHVQSGGGSVRSLSLDFGDGRGYLPATWGQPVAASYATAGTKRVKVRVTYNIPLVISGSSTAKTSGAGTQALPPGQYATYESHFDLEVLAPAAPNGAARYAVDGFIHIVAPVMGVHSGARVTVRFGGASGSRTQITKPLIVAEGYDPSFIAPKVQENISIQDFLDDIRFTNGFNLYNALEDYNQSTATNGPNGYDIIYIDYNNGTDDIRRNAALFEEVVRWVNSQKVIDPAIGAKQRNVVLGISMGGLVARYGLAEMEKRGNDPTDTRLLLTHDSPHRGANTPLGIQALTRQGAGTLAGQFIRTYNTYGLPVYFSKLALFPVLQQADDLLDAPATRQLLLVRATRDLVGLPASFGYEYNTFVNGDYRTMITPNPGQTFPYEFKATSLGSQCAIGLLAPHSELVRIEGEGYMTIFLASTGIHTEIIVNAMPNPGRVERLSGLRVWQQVRVLFFSAKIYLTRWDYQSPPNNPIAWDGLPGGTQRIKGQIDIATGSASGWRWWFPLPAVFGYNYYAALADNFCFIPTASALDVPQFDNITTRSSYISNATTGPSQPLASRFIAQGPDTDPGTGQATNNFEHPRFPGRQAQWLFNEMENNLAANAQLTCASECTLYPVVPIAGPDIICAGSTGTTFTVVPPFGGVTDWAVSPAGLATFTTPTAGATTVTLAPTSTATGMITLTAYLSNGCYSTTATQQIGVGPPATELVGPTTIACGNPQEVYHITPFFHSQTYSNLTVTGSASLKPLGYDHSGEFALVVRGPGLVHVTLDIQGPCGNDQVSLDVTVEECTGARTAAALYPNPAKETVDVHLENADAAHPVTVRLYDATGQSRAEQTSRGEATLRLNTEKLPAGLYFVHLLQGGKVVKREQLQIEK